MGDPLVRTIANLGRFIDGAMQSLYEQNRGLSERLSRIEAGQGDVNARLARIERLQTMELRVEKELLDMASKNQEIINNLKSQLERNTSATNSMKDYVTTLLAQVEDAKDDPDELQALVDGFRANTDVLVAASANTTGQPIPQQPVPVPNA